MQKLWKEKISDFQIYLKLEKSLSQNTTNAYVNDVRKLAIIRKKSQKILI